MTEQTKYKSSRELPVNSADPKTYTETPTTVTIVYQEKQNQ